MATSRRLLSWPSRSAAALLAAAFSSSLPRTDDGSVGHKVRCITTEGPRRFRLERLQQAMQQSRVKKQVHSRKTVNIAPGTTTVYYNETAPN